MATLSAIFLVSKIGTFGKSYHFFACLYLPAFACICLLAVLLGKSRFSIARMCHRHTMEQDGDSAVAMWHNTWKTLHMRQRGAATYSHVGQIASSHNSLAKIHYALCCGCTHYHLKRFSKQACQFEKTDKCSWFCLFKLLSCDLWEVFNWSDVILIRLALCFHSYNMYPDTYLQGSKMNTISDFQPTDVSPHIDSSFLFGCQG